MFRVSFESREHEKYLTIAFYISFKFTLHTEFNSNTVYQLDEYPCDTVLSIIFLLITSKETVNVQ